MPKTFKVSLREGRPPYGVLKVVRGYGVFKVFGERFAVTRQVNSTFWSATHIDTGARLRDVICERRSRVPAVAREALAKRGLLAFQNALRSVRDTISC